MPISIDLFDKGLGPEEVKVIELLESNPDKAYTWDEIASAIGKQQPLDPLGQLAFAFGFSPTLNSLTSRQLIRAKTLGGKTYYAAMPESQKAKPL